MNISVLFNACLLGTVGFFVEFNSTQSFTKSVFRKSSKIAGGAWQRIILAHWSSIRVKTDWAGI